MSPGRTALVIGATGLVGSHLVRQLLDHDGYTVVRAFTRRATGMVHEKLDERIIDFEAIATWQRDLRGDVLFSTLGTTLRAAGSKDAQYRVDYTYQYEVARAAAANGVATYVLVSSAGANARSRLFYTRMKGELDDAVQELRFARIAILRPSFLAGDRARPRRSEQIGLAIAAPLVRVLPRLRPFGPVPADAVAHAMITAADPSARERVAVFGPERLIAMV